MINPQSEQKQLILLGRVMTLIFMALGCLVAPILDNPEFKGVFNFIQQFQGYIWPGVVAAFLFGFLVKRAPASAGVMALVGGPVLYALLQYLTCQGLFANLECKPLLEMHFLNQVAVTFVALCIVMGLMTAFSPLKEAKVLPEREEMVIKTEPIVKYASIAVLTAVAIFYTIFW